MEILRGYSLCLYSPKGQRVQFFKLREQAEHRMYSSRWIRAAVAMGYTHWEFRYE